MIDIQFDSEEERLFWFYVEELKDAGFIEEYTYQPHSYELSDKIVCTWYNQLKTKQKEVTKTILQGHVYTADFEIIWSEKAYEIFFTNVHGSELDMKYLKTVPFWANGRQSIVEIKPNFDFKNMTRLAIINIKWVYNKYAIFVQKIIPVGGKNSLFAKTFVPKKALLTKTGKKKKYKFDIRSLEDYINTFKV